MATGHNLTGPLRSGSRRATWRAAIAAVGMALFLGLTFLIAPGVSLAGQDSVPLYRHFLRGDSNGDGVLDIGDAIFLLNYLFQLEADDPLCDDSADTNDDEQINVADPIYLFGYLFSMGPLPPPPNVECGPDTTLSIFLSC